MSNHPAPIDLSRAAVEGLDPDVAEHVSACPRCSEVWASMNQLDVLARELPSVAPSAERGEAALAAILATATAARPKPRPVRIAWWQLAIPTVVATAAAATLVLVLPRGHAPTPRDPVTVRETTAPTYRAAIRAQPGARFVRESSAPDEVVRLHEGSISVDLSNLAPGERFRVLVADGQVEARGGAFELTAKADTLSQVQVARGSVEVKPAERMQVVVFAGQRWTAEVTPEHETLLEAAPQRQPRIAAERPTKGAAPTHAADMPMAKLFDSGWNLLKAGNPEAAVAAFDEALVKYANDPLAEDASFWRAVGLKRMGRAGEASTAFAKFLESYPRSPRAGEATVSLGWMLLEAGQIDEAERRFAAAASDRVAAIRESAARGLAAVAAARTHH